MSRGRKVLLGIALAGVFSFGVLTGALFFGGTAAAAPPSQGGDDHAAQYDAHMGQQGHHQSMHGNGDGMGQQGMMRGTGMTGGWGNMMGMMDMGGMMGH